MLKTILSVLLLFPFIILFVLLFLSVKLRVPKKMRIGLAVDITTPFLALSVLLIMRAIWNEWMLVYVFGALFLIAVMFAGAERKRAKEFRTALVLRKTWRAFFLVLTIAYFALIITGITLQIIRYVS